VPAASSATSRVSSALPVLLRQGEALHADPPRAWRLTPLGAALVPTALARAPKQAAAWQVLHDYPGGLGPVAGKAFRLGHMGNIGAGELVDVLAAIEATLGALGQPVPAGGAVAAAAGFLA